MLRSIACCTLYSRAAARNMTTISVPFSCERQFILPSGLNIAAKVWGCETSPNIGSNSKKIIALHGYLDNANSFDMIGPALAQQGYEVVAMDFAGHGLSGHLSKDNWYELMDYSHSVVALQDTLGWEKCILVGHSLGAGIASMVAGSFPERITSCVFIDALGPFTLSPQGAAMHFRRAVKARNALQNKQQKIWPSFQHAVNARRAAASDYPGNQTISEEGARLLIERSTCTVELEGEKTMGVQFRFDLRLRAYSTAYVTEEAVHSFLSNIECPCLLITGENGMPLSGGFESRKSSLGSSLVEHLHIPGSHHLHLDPCSCEQVQQLILDFLSKIRKSVNTLSSL